MPAPPQITKNAQWVIENFGPQSGLGHFGYDGESVAYLDTFVDRQGASFRASEQNAERIISLLGSFLGEAIIATYGGDWQQTEQGLSLSIQAGGQFHILQPFQKVQKRLANGPEDSLHFYFATFLPQILSRPGPTDLPPNAGTKKPWWKFS